MALETQLLTAEQFVFYNDMNRVRELLSDDPDGEPIEEAQLDSDQTLEEMINSAEQEVMSACQVGKRYSIEDLVSLSKDKAGGTVTLSGGIYSVSGGTTIDGVGAKLRRLVAKIAWGQLVERKGFTGSEFAKMAPGYKTAMADLEQLRLGERIFWSVTGVPEAGLPAVEPLGVDAVTTGGTISSKVGLFGNIAYGYRGRSGCPRDDWS